MRRYGPIILALLLLAAASPGGAASPQPLARLYFWIPSSGTADFAPFYDEHLAPILVRRGLVANSTPASQPSTLSSDAGSQSTPR